MHRLVCFAVCSSLVACSQPTPGPDVVSMNDASQMDVVDVQTPDTGNVDGSTRYVMPSCAQPRNAFTPFGTRCQHFVDEQGRVALFQGINARVEGLFDVTFNDGRTALEEIPPFTLEDAQRMRAMGFNLLRLPLNWSGLEPLDNGTTTLDTAYLQRIDATLATAQQGGLHVLLDIHQDAYSKEIGEDGAPLWAIDPAPTMLLQGPLNDLDARRQSAQVAAAFNTFFNASTTNAMNLRARFTSMMVQLARRYRTNSTVMGYEIFNEPIAGDNVLRPFHEAVAAAIRNEDTQHLIAFEPSATRNFIDSANVPTGNPFAVAGGVYAPHVYTLAFLGTPMQRMTFTRSRLRTSWDNAVREASIWKTPLLVTEWGYDPNGIRAREYFEFQTDIQDEFGASAMFWVWKELSQGSWGLFAWDPTTRQWNERAETRRALSRVHPERVAGWPLQYRYDRDTKRFTLELTGDPSVTAPTQIYVPEANDFAARYEVRCDGVVLPVTRNALTGLVDVQCNGAGTHVLEVQALM